jgi:hypothetical protein
MSVLPKQKTTPRARVAQLVRQFGAPERGVRANTWRALEQTMKSVGISWSDVGNWIESGDGYTEEEMLEIVAIVRKEEQARAQAHAPQSNGHFATLPEPLEMVEFCRRQPHRLKDDAQRTFIDEMYASTQQGRNPPRGPLGYLASIYIKLGGRI